MVTPLININDVPQAIQLALGPVFLLTGIAGTLNVMAGRLARIIDRFGLGWIVIKLVVAVIAARMLDAQGHEWAIWVVSAGFFALSWHNVRVTK